MWLGCPLLSWLIRKILHRNNIHAGTLGSLFNFIKIRWQLKNDHHTWTN